MHIFFTRMDYSAVLMRILKCLNKSSTVLFPFDFLDYVSYTLVFLSELMERNSLAWFWFYNVGVEARGFIFGPPIALAIGAKFVPMRKPNKLPGTPFLPFFYLTYQFHFFLLHHLCTLKNPHKVHIAIHNFFLLLSQVRLYRKSIHWNMVQTKLRCMLELYKKENELL